MVRPVTDIVSVPAAAVASWQELDAAGVVDVVRGTIDVLQVAAL
jgi:hypothetical protein